MRDNRHELWEAANGRQRHRQARLPAAHGTRLGPPLPRRRTQPVQMNTQSAMMRRPRKSPPLRQGSPASRAQSRALWTPAARSAADTRRCSPRNRQAESNRPQRSPGGCPPHSRCERAPLIDTRVDAILPPTMQAASRGARVASAESGMIVQSVPHIRFWARRERRGEDGDLGYGWSGSPAGYE
jgi:hypothetical protein